MADKSVKEYVCRLSNIWTSEGKILKGESVILESKEADQLKHALISPEAWAEIKASEDAQAEIEAG